jgi:hypothetical protein
MKTHLITLASAALLIPAVALGQPGRRSFDVNVSSIGDKVFLAGGGSFDPSTGSVSGGGVFHVLQDITGGPLAGVKAGDGIRWSATQVIPSTAFRCGAPGEQGKTAVTDANTVVIVADFFLHGSSTPLSARLFISNTDQANDLLGNQNVWIQGVGCGDGNTNVR